MALIKFSEKDIKLAKRYPKVVNLNTKLGPAKSNNRIFKCSIDGYVLRIGPYRVRRIWAIKFAKWILKSFDHD